MTSVKVLLPKAFMPIAIALLASLWLGLAQAAESVGKVLFAVRGVDIVRVDGSQEPAQKGALLYQGDTVVTGEKGRAQIQFVDGARTALRPASELVIEQYEVATESAGGELVVAGGGSAVLGLLKGGMRAVSGSITKESPEGMSVKTPVATMGIRGTDFTAVLVPGIRGKFVLNVAVRDGAVRVFNGLGSIDVNAGEFASAAPDVVPALRLRPPKGILGGEENAGEGGEQEEGDKRQSGQGKGNASDNEGAGSQSSDSDGESKDDDKQHQSPNEQGQGGSQGAGEGSQEQGSKGQSESGEADSLGNERNAPVSNNNQPPGAPPPPPPAQPPAPENPPQTTGGQNLEAPDEFETSPRVVSMAGSQGNTVADIVLGQAPNSETELVIATNGSAREFLTQYSPFQSEGAGLESTFSIIGEDVDTASTFNKGADSATGFEWGRWAAGSFTAQPGPAGSNETVDLSGQESVHWVYGLPVDGNPLANIVGSAAYSLVGNTEPTDDQGNLGVLGVADMFVDFTEGLVDISLALTMNGANWQAGGQGNLLPGAALPFQGNDLTGVITNPNGPNGTVSGGSFNGSFSPNVVDIGGNIVPAGAGFTYGLAGQVNGVSSVVTGAAVVGNPSAGQ